MTEAAVLIMVVGAKNFSPRPLPPSILPLPFLTPPTNADTLVFCTQFSEAVQNSDLANYNGTVGLDLAMMQNITDLASDALPTTPMTDEAGLRH